MEKVIRILDKQGEAYSFHCPGCDMSHIVPVSYASEHSAVKGKTKPTWRFNGNMKQPTFSPDFKIEWKGAEPPQVCHAIIRDGVLIYLMETTHRYSGKRIPMTGVGV